MYGIFNAPLRFFNLTLMRFKLTLASLRPLQRITFNYQYPLAAAIYKIIQRADESYAAFLHEQGYQHGNKTFKFFTFSDLQTPFVVQSGRLVMTTNTANLIVCFHMPDAAEHFIKGLFMNQQLDIADLQDKASFTVQQVVAEKLPGMLNQSVLLQPVSPVVAGRKNERGNYDYVSPVEQDFAELLTNNLLEKYAAVNATDETAMQELKQLVTMQPVFFRQPPRHRLLTIKAGTTAETKVRGYDKFRIKITAPAAIITIALDAGIGMHNAMGMGCVEII